MRSKIQASLKAKPGKNATAPEVPPPNWPAFKPLRPTSDLSIETVVDSQIVVIRDFWTSTLCKGYVSFLKTLPLTTTPAKAKKGDALRFNDRFQITDPLFANRLWLETGLQELVSGDSEQEDEGQMTTEVKKKLWGGDVVGLNPNIRIYRYTKGQYFDCHYDESNNLSLPSKPNPIPAKTTWTLLLYLTSPVTGCEGGQTVFYPEKLPNKKSPIQEEVVIELETGMLLLHRHGNDCMLHEGREVTAGEKWVIRSDICIRR